MRTHTAGLLTLVRVGAVVARGERGPVAFYANTTHEGENSFSSASEATVTILLGPACNMASCHLLNAHIKAWVPQWVGKPAPTSRTPSEATKLELRVNRPSSWLFLSTSSSLSTPKMQFHQPCNHPNMRPSQIVKPVAHFVGCSGWQYVNLEKKEC